MDLFGDYVDRFFEKEKDRILKNYPGLTQSRLKSELVSFSKRGDTLFDSTYSPSMHNLVNLFFDKVNQGIPLGHITGRSYFYNSEFIVDSNVLIPRFETEILVELAVNEFKNIADREGDKQVLNIADLGTGSGAILLSILQELDFGVNAFGIDISDDALAIAKRNYFNLAFSIFDKTKVSFLKGDRFYNFHEKQHLIVSNPPYIKKKEDRVQVHQQVDSFEPHIALYLNDNEYDSWFQILFSQAFDLLLPGGMLIMEGHENHLKELKLLAQNIGFAEVKVVQDYTRRDRFLIGKKKRD